MRTPALSCPPPPEPTGAPRRPAQDDSLWRTLAERKWGHRATELPTVPPGGWRAWVQHRTNLVSLPPSPLHLIQEAYPDPWQHIACCVLCSRTSGGPAVRQAIAALLQRLPSPSAVLDAEEADVRELLHPLGLQDTRFAALRALSRDFLEKVCGGARQAPAVDCIALPTTVWLRGWHRGHGAGLLAWGSRAFHCERDSPTAESI